MLASWGYIWDPLRDIVMTEGKANRVVEKGDGVLREKTASSYLSIVRSTAILLGHLALTTGIVPGVIKVRTKKALFCVRVA